MNDGLPALFLSGVVSPTARLEVHLRLGDGLPGTVPETLQSLFESFVHAGRLGGYAPPDKPANQSHLTAGAPLEFRDSDLIATLEANEVDPRAFQVLRNMVARPAAAGLIVVQVEVSEVGGASRSRIELPEPEDSNEDEVYPEPPRRATFTVGWEETQFSKSRRCLVEAVTPLAAAQVVELAELARAWEDVLEADGFAMPLGPPGEVVSIAGDTTQFDEVTVEIAVSRFQASETAWNVLLNMLDAYSRTRCPIRHVAVE